MDNAHPLILDIGCGQNKMADAIGVDLDKNSDADVIHNLNIYPYPIDSNGFDRIYAKHIIEHLNDPRSFIKEIYRILKPGGVATIETPHFSSRVAYSEPQHKLYYSYFMFDSLLAGLKFEIVCRKITFYKSYRAAGIQFLANKFPDSYERFWTYIFPAENLIVEIKKRT